MTHLPVGEIVDIRIHGACVLDQPGPDGMITVACPTRNGDAYVRFDPDAAAITIVPVRDLPDTIIAAQHATGRPPGEKPVPWRTFWIVCSVIVLVTFLLAWRVGS